MRSLNSAILGPRQDVSLSITRSAAMG